MGTADAIKRQATSIQTRFRDWRLVDSVAMNGFILQVAPPISKNSLTADGAGFEETSRNSVETKYAGIQLNGLLSGAYSTINNVTSSACAALAMNAVTASRITSCRAAQPAAA